MPNMGVHHQIYVSVFKYVINTLPILLGSAIFHSTWSLRIRKGHLSNIRFDGVDSHLFYYKHLGCLVNEV